MGQPRDPQPGFAARPGRCAFLALSGLPTARVCSPIAAAALLVALPFVGPPAHSEEVLDQQVRAALLKRKDGRIARVETQYSDIFIIKRGSLMAMSSRIRGRNFTESITNLADPDDLPVRYTWTMTVGVAYPEETKSVLMIGLGGGTIATYLGRFMPDVAIDTIGIDPGVIAAAKQYFGIRETARVRYFAGDGRVFLNRSKKAYGAILVDAFRGGNVPFHLATRDFYALLKARLTPTGAAVFNVNDSMKLYASTLVTLRAAFPSVHLFPSGEGVIAVATASVAPDGATLARRAAELQQRYEFRFALPSLLAERIQKPPDVKGRVLTDDFAPVDMDDGVREPAHGR
jgi:spermidine synthase